MVTPKDMLPAVKAQSYPKVQECDARNDEQRTLVWYKKFINKKAKFINNKSKLK